MLSVQETVAVMESVRLLFPRCESLSVCGGQTDIVRKQDHQVVAVVAMTTNGIQDSHKTSPVHVKFVTWTITRRPLGSTLDSWGPRVKKRWFGRSSSQETSSKVLSPVFSSAGGGAAGPGRSFLLPLGQRASHRRQLRPAAHSHPPLHL